MSGFRRTGPCGHLQEAIVSQFWLCLEAKNCNGKPRLPRCPKCGTDRVRPFEAPPLVPYGSFACEPHGHVWHPGSG